MEEDQEDLGFGGLDKQKARGRGLDVGTFLWEAAQCGRASHNQDRVCGGVEICSSCGCVEVKVQLYFGGNRCF